MKSGLGSLLQHRRKRRKGDTRELAARLAPLEELKPEVYGGRRVPGDSTGLATQEDGAIVVGNHKLHLSKDVVEAETQKWFRVEPVVMAIVALMLAFIILIAWLVSRMPPNQQ